MPKLKKIENAMMHQAGEYPSQLTWGPFHISTDHPGFSDGLETLASALGLSPKGLFYVLQYGGHQSVQDSVAGLGKKLDEARWTEANAPSPDLVGELRYNDAEKKTILFDTAKERFDAIVAGEMGSRTNGPRLKGEEKLTREIAWEFILAYATEKGQASRLPKTAAERDVLMDKYLSVADNAARVASAVAERMAIRKTSVANANSVLDALLTA